MNSPKPLRKIAGVFIASTLIIPLSACSNSSSSKDPRANRVSDYDPEFNESPKSTREFLPNAHAEQELLMEASEAYDEGRQSVAKDLFSKFQERYPSSYFSVLAQLKTADSLFYQQDYESALLAYEDFLKLHPRHEAAAYIRFQMANAEKAKYKGIEHDQSPLKNAISSYRLLLRDYPQSEFAVLARRNIDYCREELAAHEAYVADFYFKQELFEASANRYRELIKDYPDTQAASLAFIRLEEQKTSTPEVLSYINKDDDNHQISEDKAESLSPHTPEIVFGSEYPDLKRASLIFANSPSVEKAKNSEAEIQTTNVEKTPPPEVKPLLLKLVCESSEQFDIFSLFVRKQVKIDTVEEDLAGKTLKSNNKTILATIVSDEQALIDAAGTYIPSESQTCSLEDTTISVYEKEPKGVQRKAEIIIDATSSVYRKYRLFALDRPYRLIVVAKRQQ